MFGEDTDSFCSLCSFFIDQACGALPHLHPIAMAIVAKAPIEKLVAAKKHKGWDLPIYSSGSSGFNEYCQVSFSPDQVRNGDCCYNYNRKWSWGEEAPGLSVFRLGLDGSVCV